MTHATRNQYIAGFIFSVFLTFAAYLTVYNHALTGTVLMVTLAVLAVTQLVVQLTLFLHLGSEPKPRWNLTTSLFAGMVVLIVVFGSLWIMNHLNYNMSPQQMEKNLLHNDGGF